MNLFLPLLTIVLCFTSAISTVIEKSPSICIPEEYIQCEEFFVNDGSWTNMKVGIFGIYGKFLGPYGKDMSGPFKTYEVREKTNYVIIDFLLYEIGVWKNNADTAIVIINGENIDMRFSKASSTGNYSHYSNKEGGIHFSRIKQETASNINNEDQIYEVALNIPSSYFRDTNKLEVGFRFLLTNDIATMSAGIDSLKIKAYRICPQSLHPTTHISTRSPSITPPPPIYCVPKETILRETFFENNGSWNHMRVDTFGMHGKMLGRYGKGTIGPSKTLTIPDHTDYIVIDFLFYEIDEWNCDDVTRIIINENTIVDMGQFATRDTLSNGSYSSQIDGIQFSRITERKATSIAFSSSKDRIHKVKLTIPSSYFSSTNKLIFGFQFDLIDDISVESAGIDAFEVIAYRDCSPTTQPAQSGQSIEASHSINTMLPVPAQVFPVSISPAPTKLDSVVLIPGTTVQPN